MRSVVLGFVAVVFLYGCASFRDTIPQRGPEDTESTVEQAEPILDPTDEAYERISLAVSLGDPQAAIAAYEAAELEDPEAPETRVLLANLYLAAGDVDAARGVLERVLAEDPENSDALFASAMIAGATGDEDTEQELLEQTVEIDPDHSDARAALGEIFLQERKYEAAEEQFRASLENDADNIVALIGLGNVNLRTEEPEAAETVLTRAIEIAPEYSFAYADRSRALAMQYELTDAEADLSRAIELDEDYPWHSYDRGLVRLEQNDWFRAAQDFSAFLNAEPDIFLGYVHRGRARIGVGDRAGAIADFETALELRPDYVPGYRPYAMLLFEDERFRDAATYFQKGWEDVHPNDPRDHGLAMLAALSLKYAEQNDRAREFLEDAAESLPQDSLYYEMARYFLRSVGARRGLDNRILRAIEEEPDRALRVRMKFYLAAQYEIDGRRSSALALYREVKETELLGIPEMRLAEARFDALNKP